MQKREPRYENVTIRNGRPSAVPSAGGIFILDASPTLHSTRILNNQGCGIGAVGSAFVLNGSAVSGTILAPYTEACGGGSFTTYPSDLFGGGILLLGAPKNNPSAEITGTPCKATLASSGARITLVDAGSPTLSNDDIHDNVGHHKGAFFHWVLAFTEIAS